jgi:hypothetical protein
MTGLDNPELYLGEVAAENAFVLCNGTRFTNLQGLYDSIKNADPGVFYNHVTADRNDFVNWISGCIGNHGLVNELSNIKDREVFLGVLSEQISLLRNPKLAQTMEYFKDPSKTDIGQAKPMQDATMSSPAVSTSPPIVPNTIPGSSPVPTQSSVPSAIPSISPSSSPVSDPASPITPAPVNPVPASPAPVIPVPNIPDTEISDFESVLKPEMDEIDKEITAWE